MFSLSDVLILILSISAHFRWQCVQLVGRFKCDVESISAFPAQVMLNTSRFVAEAGGQAELVLRVRQGTNPHFAFMKPDHRLHPYFRWLLHARPQVRHRRAKP